MSKQDVKAELEKKSFKIKGLIDAGMRKAILKDIKKKSKGEILK